MAGFAASELAGWDRWELGPTYAQILKSGQSLVFASRYAMVFYLLRSPRADARAAIEALRAARSQGRRALVAGAAGGIPLLGKPD